MRVSARFGALLAALLIGCGPEANDPVPAAQEPARQPDVVKAPTNLELSKQCPLGDGTAYPIAQGWLERGDYAALDSDLQRIHEAYRASHACEHYATNLFEFLRNLDLGLLDRWVAARPDSWAAVTARAGKWISIGYERRGTRFAKDVTEQEWAGMRDALARAAPDLQHAVQLQPDGFMAYAEAIRLFQLSGGERDWRPWLDAALVRDPANLTVRRYAVRSLVPSWGGSLAAMQALADDAQRFADRNPKLRELLGYPLAEQGRAEHFAKRNPEAVALLRRALARADHGDWYDQLAWCLHDMEDWQGILAISEQWRAALDQIGAYVWRGRALVELGRTEEALASYDVVLRGSPDYFVALEHRAIAYRRLGRNADAAADLRHELASHYNGWSVNQLAEIAVEDPGTARQTAELARGLVAAHPSHHEAWFLLGSALHAVGAPDAPAALERYVALAQSDGAEWARLAQARRLLDPPPPGGRTLPALAYVGLARPKP
jgi:tetratricopeptide (TPR) repeat protein